MKKIKLLICTIVITLSQLSIADTVEVEYTPPTTYTDGSALLPSDIGGFMVRLTCGSVIEEFEETSGSVTEYTITNVFGDCSVAVATYNQAGILSDYSDEIAFSASSNVVRPSAIDSSTINITVTP